MQMQGTVDAIVIGRNEGLRLVACLQSLAGQVRRVVYVDSGSEDDSVANARAAGAIVVALDLSHGFTAARARNAGLTALDDREPPEFVQFVDGDCTVDPGWIAAALPVLQSDPALAVVCGRRRERCPDASVYNRLIDAEWETPVGPAKACGGDALMRLAALRQVQGYREDLIAGEEPELCLRLARAGWGVWRIDAEMTLHDANMTRFAQWWRRTRRAGYAFAQGAALHGAGPERHWVTETRRALIWGLGVPLVAVVGGLLHPLLWLVLLAWPLQGLRLIRRGMDRQAAFHSVLGKIPEALGVLEYHLGQWRGRQRGIIEYK